MKDGVLDKQALSCNPQWVTCNPLYSYCLKAKAAALPRHPKDKAEPATQHCTSQRCLFARRPE